VSATETARPPLWPVAVELLLVASSLTIAALSSQVISPRIPAAALGYVIGAVAVTIFAAVYRAIRNSRRGGGTFRPSRLLDRTSWVLMLLGLGAGIWNAFILATELSKK